MANSTDQSRVGYVTIAIVGSRSEASRIVERLKSVGIVSFVAEERAVKANLSSSRAGGGTKIQVGRSDVDRAVRTLRQILDREGNASSSTHEFTPVNYRSWIDLESWRGATIGIAALLVFAVLLALWFF